MINNEWARLFPKKLIQSYISQILVKRKKEWPIYFKGNSFLDK